MSKGFTFGEDAVVNCDTPDVTSDSTITIRELCTVLFSRNPTIEAREAFSENIWTTNLLTNPVVLKDHIDKDKELATVTSLVANKIGGFNIEFSDPVRGVLNRRYLVDDQWILGENDIMYVKDTEWAYKLLYAFQNQLHKNTIPSTLIPGV